MKMRKLTEAIEDIRIGTGWATQEYVLSFLSNRFTREELYDLMILMADEGILFDEEKLSNKFNVDVFTNLTNDTKLSVEAVLNLKYKEVK